MVGTINSQHDPNFALNWWLANYKKGTILTKPQRIKQLEQRIANLEKGKKGKAYKELEAEAKKIYQTNRELAQFFQTEVGIKSFQEGRNLLNGLSLPQLIEQLEEKENFIGKQIAGFIQKDQEIDDLKNLASQEIKKLEKEKEEVKQSFIQGKKRGTTHWIYWKKWAEEQITNYQKQNQQLIQDYNQLDKEFKVWKEVLGTFLTKYGIKSGKLVDLGKYLEELKEAITKRDQACNSFLTKHKTKNYGEVSQKIEDLNKDNQSKQTKLSQAEKQRKDGEKAFEEIVKLVNKKKTFVFGDLQKKKIKSEMGKLKTLFGWDKVDTEAESEEE